MDVIVVLIIAKLFLLDMAYLLLWAFMKVIVALCAMFYVFGININNPAMLRIIVVFKIALAMDLCMSVILIVGECKKSYKLVTVYFRYATYVVITAIIIIAVYMTYELALLRTGVDNAPWRDMRAFTMSNVVNLATIGTVYVLFEVYIVYLLRIEVVTLKYQWKLKCKDNLSLSESVVEA